MTNPRFLTRVLLAALCALGPLAAPAAARRPAPARLATLTEGRALWVKRDQLMTRQRVITMVDQAADAGFNVLFVQVRGRGDAWYSSDLVPRADLLRDQKEPDGTPFDPLALVIRRAHARGLQVHAWFNAFLIWSEEDDPPQAQHLVNSHPEWIAVDGQGRNLADYSLADIKAANIEGAFLSPGIPAVRRHLTAAIHELADHYPLDGIHLDYIRWALVDTGYDPLTRAAFMAEQGFDPLQLRRNPTVLSHRFGPGALKSLEKTWRTWKRDQLTRFMADTRADLDALPRPIVFSVAAFPNVEWAAADVLQDWGQWARNHEVDMVVPMFYSPNTGTVMRQLALAQKALPPDVVLYAGLAVWNQPLASAAEKAVAVRNAGVQGVSFFPYDTLAETPGALRQLSRAAFGALPPPLAAGGSGPAPVIVASPPVRSAAARAATATRRADPEEVTVPRQHEKPHHPR